ncbi:hypothetical protein C448_03826 [Halococcus morrhuae DSM 1307]|uniref:Uncharacterized protein n=1 Tax=Halococcus morrhuae DSM 1307 TaxID=931277 RepID=M0MUC6_HALMO|nr:hypothetical protein [Halococcus morrhuae]EMA48374.1 hypothetical protein C448_03826 [Halococcus morrhuae DSM 1307]
MTESDRTGEFGAISLPALRRIRNLWVELEPPVTDTGYDDPIDPTELSIELADGFDDADTARFDIQWSELDNYSFHYVDSDGVNWRFDRHPNTHSPEAHFHPPPDSSESGEDRLDSLGSPPPKTPTAAAEPSCIRVEEVSLVTRAVIVMWRAAYESGDCDRLNSSSNPP